MRLVVIGAVGAALAGGLATSQRAHAASAPPCGTVLVAANQWLGYSGVNVYSNGASQSSGYPCTGTNSVANPAVQDGSGWQCVELAARLYAVKGWGAVIGLSAADIANDGNLTKHVNGSAYEPVPGDLIIEGKTSYEPYGHVAIVDRVVGASASATTIYTVEQNASVSGWHSYTQTGYTISGGYAPVIAVMHAPQNHHTVDVGIALRHTGAGGYRLAPDGGLHPFGNAALLADNAYWPGWDIARGVVLRSDNQGGYVLDGFGGIHPFGNAPVVGGSAYWPYWDIARAIVLRSDNAGGYVLDGWGGLHPFGSAPPLADGAYWPGWDIARSIVLQGVASGGYVLDGWGGLHAIGAAGPVSGSAYWPGSDIARGLAINYTGSSGGVIDNYGGLHAVSAQTSPCTTCS